MNDQTPRRYRGSLVERAAQFYDFTPPPQAAQPQAQPQPVPPAPSAMPPMPVFDAPVAPFGMPMGHPAQPTAPVQAPAQPQGAMPSTQPQAAMPSTRRQIVIDRAKLNETGMIVPGGTVTALAEEFRLTKRQLLNMSKAIEDRDKARMILVCSAKPNDGKTFCAINLALSMAAEKDVEILLVDADFAKPDILRTLGASDGPGLLDVLNGNVASAEDCVLDTDVPQLSVLPAGTRSNADTELLASERAHAILDGLAAANPRRIVIFDSPPILAASPASVLASHVGQVMLVVRADQTSEGDLREAVALLDGCEQIQLLLNSVSFQPGGRRYGGYGAYYGEAGK